MEKDYDSLALRVAQLEKKIENGLPAPYPTDISVSPGQEMPAGANGNLPAGAYGESAFSGRQTAKPALPKAIPEDVQQIVRNWRSIVEELSGGLKNYLKLARPSLSEGGQLLLILEDEVAESFVNTEEHRQELTDAMARKTGKEVSFKIEANSTNQPFEESYVDLEKMINMEIMIED